jgi:hypothetical protein
MMVYDILTHRLYGLFSIVRIERYYDTMFLGLILSQNCSVLYLNMYNGESP